MSQASHSQIKITVSQSDMPLSCSGGGNSHVGTHPRVYLPIQPGEVVSCYYCGAQYHWPLS